MKLGHTDIEVSRLGLGCGHIGGDDRSDGEVDALLSTALDLGITFFDTARGYGRSEERLGRWLAAHRAQVVVSSKCGYGVEGVNDWSGECVARGVDAALARLRTDFIDVMHLHSCPRDVLERGEVTHALMEAKRAGKIRATAYSGDNDGLAAALALGCFDVVQTSFNLCDQHAPPAGCIAKRPLANAPWRFAEPPHAGDIAEYWHRFRALALDAEGCSWEEIAIRFAAYAPHVATAIVGTGYAGHLRDIHACAERGPLPAPMLEHIRARYEACARDWAGVI